MKVLERVRVRLILAVVAGVAGALVGSAMGAAEAALIGIAIAGALFVASGWLVLWPMTSAETKEHAPDEDLGRRDEYAVVGFALAGLGGVVALLVGGTDAGVWSPAIAVIAVFMAWAALHLMYATRYATQFYSGDEGGIEFNSTEPPTFKDFLYFSYNLGMTYQVSDNNVQTTEIRAIVLRHSLLSYVFGTAILATTINLVVGALAR